MTQKTAVISGSSGIDGETMTTLTRSFVSACVDLETRAKHEDREVLWDTVEIRTEREFRHERRLDEVIGHDVPTWGGIHITAQAVLR